MSAKTEDYGEVNNPRNKRRLRRSGAKQRLKKRLKKMQLTINKQLGVFIQDGAPVAEDKLKRAFNRSRSPHEKREEDKLINIRQNDGQSMRSRSPYEHMDNLADLRRVDILPEHSRSSYDRTLDVRFPGRSRSPDPRFMDNKFFGRPRSPYNPGQMDDRFLGRPRSPYASRNMDDRSFVCPISPYNPRRMDGDFMDDKFPGDSRALYDSRRLDERFLDRPRSPYDPRGMNDRFLGRPRSPYDPRCMDDGFLENNLIENIRDYRRELELSFDRRSPLNRRDDFPNRDLLIRDTLFDPRSQSRDRSRSPIIGMNERDSRYFSDRNHPLSDPRHIRRSRSISPDPRRNFREPISSRERPISPIQGNYLAERDRRDFVDYEQSQMNFEDKRPVFDNRDLMDRSRSPQPFFEERNRSLPDSRDINQGSTSSKLQDMHKDPPVRERSPSPRRDRSIERKREFDVDQRPKLPSKLPKMDYERPFQDNSRNLDKSNFSSNQNRSAPIKYVPFANFDTRLNLQFDKPIQRTNNPNFGMQSQNNAISKRCSLSDERNLPNFSKTTLVGSGKWKSYKPEPKNFDPSSIIGQKNIPATDFGRLQRLNHGNIDLSLSPKGLSSLERNLMSQQGSKGLSSPLERNLMPAKGLSLSLERNLKSPQGPKGRTSLERNLVSPKVSKGLSSSLERNLMSPKGPIELSSSLEKKFMSRKGPSPLKDIDERISGNLSSVSSFVKSFGNPHSESNFGILGNPLIGDRKNDHYSPYLLAERRNASFEMEKTAPIATKDISSFDERISSNSNMGGNMRNFRILRPSRFGEKDTPRSPRNEQEFGTDSKLRNFENVRDLYRSSFESRPTNFERSLQNVGNTNLRGTSPFGNERNVPYNPYSERIEPSSFRTTSPLEIHSCSTFDKGQQKPFESKDLSYDSFQKGQQSFGNKDLGITSLEKSTGKMDSSSYFDKLSFRAASSHLSDKNTPYLESSSNLPTAYSFLRGRTTSSTLGIPSLFEGRNQTLNFGKFSSLPSGKDPYGYLPLSSYSSGQNTRSGAEQKNYNTALSDGSNSETGKYDPFKKRLSGAARRKLENQAMREKFTGVKDNSNENKNYFESKNIPNGDFITVPIIWNNYPHKRITHAQAQIVKEYLHKKLNEVSSEKPEFQSIALENGVLFVNCVDERSSSWLLRAVEESPKIKNAFLRAVSMSEVKLARVKVHVRGTPLKAMTFLEILDKQNPDMEVHKWRLLNEDTLSNRESRYILQLNINCWIKLMKKNRTLPYNNTRLRFMVLYKNNKDRRRMEDILNQVQNNGDGVNATLMKYRNNPSLDPDEHFNQNEDQNNDKSEQPLDDKGIEDND